MPYCPNCGKPLIDQAKFCMECGTPVAPKSASIPPSAPDIAPDMPGVEPNVPNAAPDMHSFESDMPNAAPNVSIPPQAAFRPSPMPSAPASPAAQNAAPRGKTGLILGLAIGAVVIIAALVVVLVLLLGGAGSSSLPAEKNPTAQSEPVATSESVKKGTALTEETTETDEETTKADEEEAEPAEEGNQPLYTAQGIEVAQITALLEAYKAATDAVIDATTDDFAAEWNRGNLYDYDGDGYPELVLLYSLDGIALESAIFRRTDNSDEPVCMQQELWAGMAGGAAGAIYYGTLDTGESVIFLESTNWEGETKVGKDYVYSLADNDIRLLYQLEWYADVEGDLINCWVFDADGERLSRDNTEQFMNIFNAREYHEADYPGDQYGVMLPDLFSDEAMAAYYS